MGYFLQGKSPGIGLPEQFAWFIHTVCLHEYNILTFTAVLDA